MPDVQRTLASKLYFQCLGGPEAWKSSEHPRGFPGISVPDVLQYCRQSVNGRPPVDGQQITVPIPNDPQNPTQNEQDAFRTACQEAIRPIFNAAVGTEGPGPNAWAIIWPGWPTIRNDWIWIWGIDAIAFELGIQSLDASGDRNGQIVRYVQTDTPTSSDGTPTPVVGRYLMYFDLN